MYLRKQENDQKEGWRHRKTDKETGKDLSKFLQILTIKSNNDNVYFGDKVKRQNTNACKIKN